MRISLRWIAPALGLGILASAIPFAPVAAALPDDAQVGVLMEKRIDNPRIGSDLGMVVIDGATGAVVSSHGADALMLPASTMKIITAVNVLSTMGAKAILTTRVRAGSSANEVILEGGGDPLLTSADLQTMATTTAAQVDPKTRVVVHVDDDLFPATKRGPGWTSGYLPYVAAPVEALARLSDYSSDPSTNAAKVFIKKLRSLGLKAKLGDPKNADPSAAVLAESTNTVADAVAVMLSYSENNVAEVLYRQVALAKGHEASWDGARVAAEQALAALGLDASGMKLLDGSGLSRKDRLSATFLGSVLRVARITNPGPFTSMFEPKALPVSGKTGTLATAYGRYVTKHARCARGDVHAKTGSLFDTIALAGVARTVSGGERMFAFLVNDRPQQYSALSTRQALDGLSATVTGCWD